MKAGDVMTTGAATVRADAPLAEAARIMVEHHVSGLPVTDEAGKLAGIVTERDFLRRPGADRPSWAGALLGEAGANAAKELRERRVSDTMTPNPVSVGVETPLDEVLDLLERHGVRRLPVVENGKVVGIVSRANLLLALVRAADRAGGGGLGEP
jgi:CBS domain-containing protein